MLERLTMDATRINRFVNHPAIFPVIAGGRKEPFDLSDVSKNSNHVILADEYGGIVFIKHQLGIYEAHSAVLPEYRGAWALGLALASMKWMFTHTDAIELMTKCPHGNLAAVALTRATGGVKQFSTRPLWPTPDGMVGVDVFSITIQDWCRKFPDLEAHGELFHDHLKREYKRLGIEMPIHPDDKDHDRYVGAAVCMIEGGQPLKAVQIYNRWANMSGYKPISIRSENPLVMDISEALLRITGNSFEVMSHAHWRN